MRRFQCRTGCLTVTCIFRFACWTSVGWSRRWISEVRWSPPISLMHLSDLDCFRDDIHWPISSLMLPLCRVISSEETLRSSFKITVPISCILAGVTVRIIHLLTYTSSSVASVWIKEKLKLKNAHYIDQRAKTLRYQRLWGYIHISTVLR